MGVLEFLDNYNAYIKNFNQFLSSVQSDLFSPSLSHFLSSMLFSAVMCYEKLHKFDDFADWCTTQSESHAALTRGLDIPSFLIMPVQVFVPTI